jgi:hypothetical protein
MFDQRPGAVMVLQKNKSYESTLTKIFFRFLMELISTNCYVCKKNLNSINKF